MIPDSLKAAQAFLERNLPTMDLDGDPTNTLKTLYQLAWKKGITFPPVVTELFWYCGIDPLEYLDFVPAGYVAGMSLYAFDLPSNIRTILRDAFRESSLTHIELKEGLQMIGPSAFAGCASLDSVDFPVSLQVLHRAAFSVSGLKSVRLGEHIQHVAETAFYGCLDLEQAVIETSSPLHRTFESCTRLTNVEFTPKCKTTAISEAFANCVRLNSITLPESLTHLGVSCFQGCVQLRHVQLPEGIQHIGAHAFKQCRKLHQLHYNGTRAQWETVHLAPQWQGSVKEVVCTDGSVYY